MTWLATVHRVTQRWTWLTHTSAFKLHCGVKSCPQGQCRSPSSTLTLCSFFHPKGYKSMVALSNEFSKFLKARSGRQGNFYMIFSLCWVSGKHKDLWQAQSDATTTTVILWWHRELHGQFFLQLFVPALACFLHKVKIFKNILKFSCKP